MNNEIKEINLSEMLFNRDERLLDYITNLQQKEELLRQEISDVRKAFNGLQQENERLKGIAHKMHLWIFLNSGNEQKVYNELGLTDEENIMLGYSGQIRIGGGDNER